MLDINFIKQNKSQVQKAVEDKQLTLDLDELLNLDEQRRALIQSIDDLRQQVKNFNKNINNIDVSEKEKSLVGMKVLSLDLKDKEKKLREVEIQYNNLMLFVPNIPSDDTPIGKTDEDNVEFEKWGEPRNFDFVIKSHIELGKELDLVDFEKGVKVSGFRGYYLKNEAAILQMALLLYTLQKITGKGFVPMITPTILKEFALTGSGHFPFGKDDIYSLANAGMTESGDQIKEELFLAGTSEPSLLAYFADDMIDEKDLPKKVCGFSQCYRNEVGSYGKDVKGLYRIHEFMKVEQVVLCKADLAESDKWLESLKSYAQEILQDLELPHRVIQVCTGDMGAGKRKMYDIETWMPSRNSYGETHSDSNLTDWQSRRLNIKYKDQNGEKKYVYALNNTAIASPRILIAILENNQNPDGSVNIPKVLVPYCGFEKIERKK